MSSPNEPRDEAAPAPTASVPSPAPNVADRAPGSPAGAGDPWLAPPRQYWINPSRRRPVILSAVAAGLALLLIGGVAGAAINDHGSGRDDHGGGIMLIPPGHLRQLPDGASGIPGPMHRPHPPKTGGSHATATPAPTHTS